MASIQTVGFQCVIEAEGKDGKKVEKKVGRVYTCESAAQELAVLYVKSGQKAWVTNIYKAEGPRK